jgi:hypothetical protein
VQALPSSHGAVLFACWQPAFGSQLSSVQGFPSSQSRGWLVDLMEPGARHDVGLAVFWRKLARLQTFERPVLPYLRGLAESGLTPEEVAARLAAAGAPVADVTNRRTTSAAAAAP